MKKPPYLVPSMEAIRAIPWNGLKVASTFSGCGGSCTGYRMAGFRVVWANEFVPIAQESYKANADPSCYLDRRDIKLVQPEDVLSATGLKVGELDMFDGSPPCQAFSTAGQREKGWGKKKTYEHGASQCNETLFSEYIRLVRGLQPRTFVAENVSGLIKGTAKGMFLEILRDLKACGYRVACRVLDAKWLGVPQSRQRTIFVGVRNDLDAEPAYPKPLQYLYSVRDAMPWIARATHDVNGLMSAGDITNMHAAAVMAQRQGSHWVESETEYECIMGNDAFKPVWGSIDSGPSPTILSSGPHGGSGELRIKGTTERRKFTIAELKRICGFPDDFILCGTYAQQWERLGNSVPPVMMSHIAAAIRDGVLLKACANV